MSDFNELSGVRCLLVNLKIFPSDLRGEAHAPDKWKSERAMNFGLPVIATYLAKKGATVLIVDLEEDVISDEIIQKFSPHIVGIGTISCYSLRNKASPCLQDLGYN